MSQYFEIHPENPQGHLLRQAVTIIQRGGVIVYPTDSGYALGCQMGDKAALEKIRTIRQLSEKHHFTLVCRDLSELSTYATFNDNTYRLLKAHTPGPYTFLLKATKEVPKRLQDPQRKTIGMRIPDYKIALALLDAMDEPLMSTTLILPNSQTPLIEPRAIKELLGKRVDLIIDGGYCGQESTTMVDLTEGTPRIVRIGKGDPTPFLYE